MSSIYDWSKTASSNGTADSDINWQEGQPPSTVNNSARQMMARQKEFIDDMGAVTAAGTANAITVTLSSAVTAYFDGLRFSFKAANTNTATTTINVNGLGAKTAVIFGSSSGEKPLTAGVIRAGCVYDAVYLAALNSSAGGWLIKNVSESFVYTERNSNYTAVAADSFGTSKFTASATLSLTAAATLTSGWRHKVINGSSGDVTIDPDSTELINGAGTLILKPNQTADIFCNGTAFTADVHGDTLSGPQLQGYATGLALTTNATDAANDVDIAVGAAAADTSPYYLMQLTSALTKRIDANWAVGTNQGGLDTGSVQTAATYYIWLIQRSDTGVVDALFSTSSTAPTMPTNYDRKRLIGTLIRASSTNGGLSLIAPFLQSRAAGYFIVSGTTLTEQRKIASSVTRIVTGVYEVTLATAAPDVNYIVQVTGKQVAASSVNTSICEDASFSRTTTAFRIRSQASDGSEVDPSGCSYEVKW